MAQLQGQALFYCILLLTCNSFLLIGFDNGVLGGLVGQPAFQKTFDTPGPTILGLIVSLYEVGCFLGSVMTAFVGESLGRRRSMCFGGVVMAIGALLQATSYGRVQIFVARIVSGVGMGFINSTAPVYQSEFSPKERRGLYACAQLSTLNFGIFLSYWIDYAYAGNNSSYAWRIPVILQCIFIFAIIFLSWILPETPRWLIAHGRQTEAKQVYERLLGSSRANDEAFEHIIHAVTLEDQVQHKGLSALLTEDDIGSRKRFLIACGVQFFQQLGGINGIIYYAGTIFSESLGFDSHMSSLMSGFLFTWFFIASFIPWALIDRVGRRPLLIYSIALMAIIFACMAGLVSQIQYNTSIAHVCGIAATVLLFLYLGAFTVGFQATVWVYPPEILPLRIRQVGTATATAANWVTNFMVVQITPVGISSIGWKYYIIFAIFNACFVPIIYKYFPETKGLVLEDVDRLFTKGSLETELYTTPTNVSHENKSGFYANHVEDSVSSKA